MFRTTEFTISGNGNWKKEASLYDASTLIGFYINKVIDIEVKFFFVEPAFSGKAM